MTQDSLKFSLPINLEEVSPEIMQRELTQSYEVIKKILPFLAKRGIPASPKNFRLFYDYVQFVNPELNKVLNELLEKDAKFHSRLSDTLYIFFYSDEIHDSQTRAITKAASEFMDVSNTMAESLESARVQNDRFHKALSDTSRQMTGLTLTGHSDLQPVLDDLLAETEQTLAAGDLISARLKEANEIISALKAELKSQTDLAKFDELTKLSNRRHLSLEAPGIIREALEKKRVLSAIAFDIDFFKSINDTWGHNNGDKVLTICAGIIKNAARSSDLAVRMGGEEFLLLCGNLGLATAAKVADRIRESIASTDININGASLTVTVSGGVAEYVPGEDLSSLIGRADHALSQAKGSGRNRICVAEAGDQPLITDKNSNLDEKIAAEPATDRI
jgi:diguanylate cyclase